MVSAALTETLQRAWDLGFLGPGPIDVHVRHAAGYVRGLRSLPEGAVICDLGSGGGLPGLVLADALPHVRLVLIEAHLRRAAHLEEAIRSMRVEDRVVVRTERAELTGRAPDLRGTADAVVARSFGAPALTAECAAPLLRVGGLLLVSEPPDAGDDTRWPESGLLMLGLRSTGCTMRPRMAHFVQDTLCDGRFPRRVGIPGKRPLWKA